MDSKTQKMLGLELIRFLSALAVLFWHYQHFSYVSEMPVNFVKEQQPFYSSFAVLYEYGYWGVKVFWSISGYIFFWKYAASIGTGNVSVRTFFILRFSRLYPLHVATLFAVVVMQMAYMRLSQTYFVYQHNDLLHFILQLFLASNWIGMEHEFSFNGPIWSISLEVLIYALFYAFVRILGASLAGTVCILILCAVLKSAGLTYQVIDCVEYFFLGGVVMLLGQASLVQRYKTGLSMITGVYIAVNLAALAYMQPKQIVQYYTLAPIAILPATLYFFAEVVKLPNQYGKYAEFLGNLTYSIYLLHFPITLAIVILCNLSGLKVQYESPLLFLLFMSLSFGLSALTYRYFELPAQRYLRARITS